MVVEALVWYAFLADSFFANIASWCFPSWFKKRKNNLWKHLPLTKAWTTLYLLLVLWVGWTLLRLGVLPY